jgi:hypothetical protein
MFQIKKRHSPHARLAEAKDGAIGAVKSHF